MIKLNNAQHINMRTPISQIQVVLIVFMKVSAVPQQLNKRFQPP